MKAKSLQLQLPYITCTDKRSIILSERENHYKISEF